MSLVNNDISFFFIYASNDSCMFNNILTLYMFDESNTLYLYFHNTNRRLIDYIIQYILLHLCNMTHSSVSHSLQYFVINISTIHSHYISILWYHHTDTYVAKLTSFSLKGSTYFTKWLEMNDNGIKHDNKMSLSIKAFLYSVRYQALYLFEEFLSYQAILLATYRATIR